MRVCRTISAMRHQRSAVKRNLLLRGTQTVPPNPPPPNRHYNHHSAQWSLWILSNNGFSCRTGWLLVGWMVRCFMYYKWTVAYEWMNVWEWGYLEKDSKRKACLVASMVMRLCINYKVMTPILYRISFIWSHSISIRIRFLKGINDCYTLWYW